MSDARLRAAIATLALAGVGITAYLTYARYADVQLVCATGGCETVQQSEYSKVLGMPVAVLGLVGYLAILATAFAPAGLGAPIGAALSVGGLAFSLYLLYVQLAVIDAICQWCVASDGVMTLLAAACVARLLLRASVTA